MDFYWILWASLAQLHCSSSLEFMGLQSTPYFLCFHYFGPAVAHSYFSTSYIAHGLLFLSFRAPLSPFTSSRPICSSHGLMIHYFCRSGLMGFLSVCQLFSVRITGPLPSTWASEMAINSDIMSNLFSKICWRKFVPSKNKTISISIFHCSISTNITF